MTQIISVATREYFLLVSDRRLTYVAGRKKGRVADDDTCKLVNWNNIAAIAYTGLAHIGNRPTNEWIGIKLAKANCVGTRSVASTLITEATKAFKHERRTNYRQAFLMADWGYLQSDKILRPSFTIITNSMNDNLSWITPKDEFYLLQRSLKDEEEFMEVHIGQKLSTERHNILLRNVRKLLDHSIGPMEMLRLLSDEIIYTSKIEKTVGDKILGVCIPRVSAEKMLENKPALVLSGQPNLQNVTFTYFEDGYDEAIQYGPTTVFGGTAVTDVRTLNSNKGRKQSSGCRYLHLPNTNKA